MGCAGSTNAFDLSKIYYISPKHAPSKVLGCAGGEATSGTKIVIWEKDGSDNQKWKVEKTDDGLYSFHPLHAQGQRIDNPKVKEQCHLWDQNEDAKNPNQLWSMEDVEGEDNTFFIKIPGDATRVLDVEGLKDENGAVVYTWDDWTKADNQKWVFTPVDGEAAPVEMIDCSCEYHIVAKHAPSKVFGCAGGEATSGTKVVLWEKDGSDNQKWTVHKAENGTYSFAPVHAPGQRLDNPNVKEQCHIWDQNEGGENPNQFWSMTPVDGEEMTFFVKCGDRVLDVAEMKDENGAVVYTWDEFTQADNQKFQFVKA